MINMPAELTIEELSQVSGDASDGLIAATENRVRLKIPVTARET